MSKSTPTIRCAWAAAVLCLPVVITLPAVAEVVQPNHFAFVGGPMAEKTYNFAPVYRKLDMDSHRDFCGSNDRHEIAQSFVELEVMTLLDTDWMDQETYDMMNADEDEEDDAFPWKPEDAFATWQRSTMTLQASAQTHRMMTELMEAAKAKPHLAEQYLKRPLPSPTAEDLSRPIELELDAVPWSRLPERLSEAAGVEVKIHWTSVAHQPLDLDETVTARLDGPLNQVLPELFKTTRGNRDTQVQAGPSCIWVGSRNALKSVNKHVYAVSVKRLKRSLRGDSDERFFQMEKRANNWQSDVRDPGSVVSPTILWADDIFYFCGTETEFRRLCELIVEETGGR